MENDAEIRFEVVKILGKRIPAELGISEIIFDAQALFDFIKSGKRLPVETIANATDRCTG